eukprot:GHVP01059806.1.p1 GENE.GHVP01059806.1~~GHVP01059806.1.p1  ORF type:complete len:120 (-),score=13.04 GHVP01059806.1:246-605(-)
MKFLFLKVLLNISIRVVFHKSVLDVLLFELMTNEFPKQFLGRFESDSSLVLTLVLELAILFKEFIYMRISLYLVKSGAFAGRTTPNWRLNFLVLIFDTLRVIVRLCLARTKYLLNLLHV